MSGRYAANKVFEREKLVQSENHGHSPHTWWWWWWTQSTHTEDMGSPSRLLLGLLLAGLLSLATAARELQAGQYPQGVNGAEMQVARASWLLCVFFTRFVSSATPFVTSRCTQVWLLTLCSCSLLAERDR